MPENSIVDIVPISFPAEIISRISPSTSLQRHLATSIRPSLRALDEFRDISINKDEVSHYAKSTDASINIPEQNNEILGFNVLKSGKTVVVTTITGFIVEDLQPVSNLDIGAQELLDETQSHNIANYTSIFPSVSIECGRKTFFPSDEEMIIAQKLHSTILHSGLISKEALRVNCGIRSVDDDGNISIMYPDEVSKETNDIFDNISNKKKWSYGLYAKISVFGSDGPVFDLCWNSLMYALKSTKLPRAFVDERTSDLKMTIRTKGKSLTVREAYEILCDPNRFVPLKIKSSSISFASNFGIINLDPESQLITADDMENMNAAEPVSVLLADIATEIEKKNVRSTISIISTAEGNFKNFTIIGGEAKITPEMIRSAIKLSLKRSEDLSKKDSK